MSILAGISGVKAGVNEKSPDDSFKRTPFGVRRHVGAFGGDDLSSQGKSGNMFPHSKALAHAAANASWIEYSPQHAISPRRRLAHC